jgi:hypothetical protein
MNDHSSSNDHPTEVTGEEARQATGPRDMFAVLLFSLVLAAVAGTALLAYFLA